MIFKIGDVVEPIFPIVDKDYEYRFNIGVVVLLQQGLLEFPHVLLVGNSNDLFPALKWWEYDRIKDWTITSPVRNNRMIISRNELKKIDNFPYQYMLHALLNGECNDDYAKLQRYYLIL